MGQFALAIEDVDRDEDDAELDASQIQVDNFEAISEIDAEAIARLEPALGEQLGQPIAARVDVAKGIGDALKFEGGMIAPADEGQIEELEKIQMVKIACHCERE